MQPRLLCLLSLVFVAACGSDPVSFCSNGDVCPGDTTCKLVAELGENRCLSDDEVAICENKDDGTNCTVNNADGICRSQVCVVIECGNRIFEPKSADNPAQKGEACDPSDKRTSGRCSADCSSTLVCGNGTIDVAEGEECDDGVTGLSNDECSSECKFETPSWTAIGNRDFARRTFASAYDTARQELVVFGGHAASDLDDTLVLSDQKEGEKTEFAFTVKLVSTHPSARRGAAMAYDQKEDDMILFGGSSEGSLLADTWIWNGDSWEGVPQQTDPPPGSLGPAMIYDKHREKLLLLTHDTNNVSSTWTWDWITKTWTEEGGINPPPRNFSAVGYHEQRDCIVVVGGQAPDGRLLDDVWTRCRGGAWVSLAAAAPTPRKGATLSYFGGAMTLIGGEREDGLAIPPVATLSLSAAEWQTVEHAVGQISTSTRAGHSAFVHDNSLHVFAGQVAARVGADVQASGVASPITWIPLTPSIPRALRAATAANDPLMGYVVMIGGGLPNFSDIAWLWNGSTWRNTNSAGLPPVPPVRTRTALATRATGYASSEHLLFGGYQERAQPSDRYLGDTWIFDGKKWKQSSNMSSPSPSRRSDAMLAFDQANDVYVLFGGRDANVAFDDTWLRRKKTNSSELEWVQVATQGSRPPARYDAAFAYHPVLRKTYLFGGRDVAGRRFNDVWSFDGSNWKQEVTTGAPPPRSSAKFVYAGSLRQLVLFGGDSGTSVFSQLFTFDGATWKEIEVANAPPPRTEFALAYDARNAALLMFGGFDGSDRGDQWMFRFANLRDPAEACIEHDADTDGDGLRGCADPDCWYICDPTCPPGASCPDDRSRCGDGKPNAALENASICPQDAQTSM